MSPIQQTVSHAFERSLDLLRGAELYSYQDILLRCRERLEEPMRIALVGEVCSSKSTLANAMLGEEEIVRTGTMEETFNVSLLKEGDSNSSIVVHFRPPSGHTEKVPRTNWASWANRLGQDEMTESVQYIEVNHDNPLLRTFNLIDTPGLNSYYGADSRNTVEFLTSFTPDAVVVLFTRGIAQRTVDVIRAFQGPIFQNLSPINTIGVLTRIDEYWPSEDSPLAAGRRIAARLIQEEPSIKSSFFRLYPVSSLLALGARTIDSNDMRLFHRLVKTSESCLSGMFKSVRRFFKNNSEISLSISEREYLFNKFTMYGVFHSLKVLQRVSGINEALLQQELLSKSGFDAFFRDVLDHFGNRAYIIKLSSVISTIQRESQTFMQLANSNKAKMIRDIVNRFTEIGLHHQVFRELELLKRLYSGELQLDDEQTRELFSISGEYGTSCREKLGLDESCTCVGEMLSKAQDRFAYWNSQLVTSINPQFKDAAHIMKASYHEISRQIKSAQAVKLEAEAVLFGASCKH